MMGDTPETIWAGPCDDKDPQFEYGQWTERRVAKNTQEYRRADIPATNAQIMAHPKVQALVGAAEALMLDPTWGLDHKQYQALRHALAAFDATPKNESEITEQEPPCPKY